MRLGSVLSALAHGLVLQTVTGLQPQRPEFDHRLILHRHERIDGTVSMAGEIECASPNTWGNGWRRLVNRLACWTRFFWGKPTFRNILSESTNIKVQRFERPTGTTEIRIRLKKRGWAS